MRKMVVWIITLVTSTAGAQLQLPELSPEAHLKQQVGYVNFDIHYGRPAARGRKIFGALVPFNEVWRTGGGASTKIAFDKPVTIAGKPVAAGTYALVTIPRPGHWTVLLNTNTTKIFGAQQDGYDVATEVVRWEVPTQRTDHFYESFTIDLDIVNNDVECYLRWENTQVHFSIATHNNALALQNIETHLAANPTDADNLAYAAYYLRMNNQEPQRLLGYVDRALQIKEDAWFYELKMNLLAEAGRVAEARTVYEAAIGYLRKARPAHWQDTERHLKHLTEQWK